ncbi:MAG: cytochrome c-type biosis protein [Chloroflexota bacterium]|jgi:cytochrome c-type biogenesis protein|nr:cytochrome c-type biosis protein [Chloroflexota bacterium]
MELTLGAALIAGLVSFLSPCVLPVVPAYLGQLGVIVTNTVSPAVLAVGRGGLVPAAGGAVLPRVELIGRDAAPIDSPSRAGTWGRSQGWRALPNAIAFVCGFTLVFTLFGLALSGVLQPLRENQALLRQAGGVVLIVLGLNLMGILRLSRLAGSWRPLDRFTRTRSGERRSGILGGLSLGAIFAVGWTPCIGPTLGAVLTLAVAGPSPQVAALLVAYGLGLGIPFLLLAVAVDRAPGITRPLIRHGRAIEVFGGGLVVVIGIALLFNWLDVLARSFSNLWPQV